MNPGDRLVVVFVQPARLHDTFKEWPLHVTIVPWFRSVIASKELAHEWKHGLQAVEPFDVLMGGEEGFGFKGKKLVNLVEPPSPLFVIHDLVRTSLNRHDAWLVDETTSRRRAFRPHVTHQRGERLHPGDMFRCDRLHIVEQHGSHKEIVGEIKLG